MTAQDIRHLITLVEAAGAAPVQTLCESASNEEIEEGIKAAADDFIFDWNRMSPGEEDGEPEPRLSFFRRLKAAGVQHAYDDGVAEMLIPMMREEAHRFLATLQWRNGVLPVFRNIVTAEGWEQDPEKFGGLGVYWATDDGWSLMIPAAGQVRHTISSEVRSEQVNWFIVVMKYLTYTENEIRIRNNERVPILAVSRQGVPLDVSHLSGRLFSVGKALDEWGD